MEEDIRLYKLKHPDLSCRCYPLARLFLNDIQPKSLVNPSIVNKVCAIQLAVADTQLRSIATETKIAAVFHPNWCVTHETLELIGDVDHQVRLFSQLTQLLQKEQYRLQRIVLERKTDKQDDALL
jgi:hypothetical protein